MNPSKPLQAAKDLWKDTSQALLSTDEVDILYTRLQGLVVTLDEDPLAYGPKPLQAKTAMCRMHLATTEKIFLDVSHRLHRLKRDLRAKKCALELATKYLYATDPEVRAGRNISDREAFAAVKLKDEWLEVHECEQKMQDMEAVLLVIKAKRSDLRDIQSRIRDQVRLCSEEIGLGSRWGAKAHNGGFELEPGQGFANGGDVQSVMDLIDDMDDIHSGISLTDFGDESEDDDVVETPKVVSTPAGYFVRPQVDLDDFGDAEVPKSPNSVSEADKVSSETSLSPALTKTAEDALPSNGSTSGDIDLALNQVQVPEPKAKKTISGFADPGLIDSLLENF